jgi:Ethanolamine utilization protein EutJ (predicted chaperonin)
MNSRLVRFTNNADEHKGNPIYINIDHISAIYEAPSTPGGSLKTFVFGGYTGVQWEIAESPKQALELIYKQRENGDPI